MKTKSQILERMALYRVEGGGIGSWLTDSTKDAVFERLGKLESHPLPAAQLNQLLVLGHEAPVSDGFFRYYWLDLPNLHPYSVRTLPGFDVTWKDAQLIQSLDQFAWGFHRLYMDGLLYFGNIRTAFRALRDFSYIELQEFFSARRVNTDAIERRGPSLPLKAIEKDRRYLISEMACKSYGQNPQSQSNLKTVLESAYVSYASKKSGGTTTVRALLEEYAPSEFQQSLGGFLFSALEILDKPVGSQDDLGRYYSVVSRKFEETRCDALENTQYYLSMLTDLDVYVATSMRTREDFLRMAEICESVFNDPRVQGMNLRYFDPTMSAAEGHEDKGLIECLMVKCAKALVYCRGEKESYGKDAEAAMALSLGKPVIFYCEEGASFYREVHPLARLIQFETGIAVGAMVTDKLPDVAELLARTFENKMIYRLERSHSGSLRLKECITDCVIRLQTSDKLLTETFWNHYHRDNTSRQVQPAVVREDAGKGSTQEKRTVVPLRPERAQASLQLDDSSQLLPLAARSSSQAIVPEIAKEASKTAVSRSNELFPMSVAEVFDGISKIKIGQSVGGKRYAVFSEWLRNEGIGIADALKLLRFIEATLDANSARPGHVYKRADLMRWYQEMFSGAVLGSWR